MRPPDGAVYRFDPGALSLELLTTGGPDELSVFETLHAPEDWLRWLSVCRLRLRDDEVDISATDISAIRGVRDAVLRLARASTRGAALSEPDLDTLNLAAAHSPMIPTLARDGTQRWRTPVSSAQALSTVARDAVTLMSGPYAERIRECAATDCALVFVDTSRPGKRRWCSMERCGNRSKIRALRARRTETP
ncbi:CGNR zinc finger domain-containing protein [Spiractinospora alimapuensis]|nr:CGNR zinc finger domain-containing protein [Spiractinospora alimapuensis]